MAKSKTSPKSSAGTVSSTETEPARKPRARIASIEDATLVFRVEYACPMLKSNINAVSEALARCARDVGGAFRVASARKVNRPPADALGGAADDAGDESDDEQEDTFDLESAALRRLQDRVTTDEPPVAAL